jgi:hypothetical protein
VIAAAIAERLRLIHGQACHDDQPVLERLQTG